MSPPLWICLQCGNQGCGRMQKQHAKEHWKTPHSDVHCLAIESHNWLIWCYECDNEVSADSRKSLLETVEFIKKLATTSYTPSQPAIPLPPIEQQQQQPPDYNKLTSPIREKPKILTNLTRVGGLMNLGNTCFFNSVMQCLAQTPFLVKVLEDLCPAGEKFTLPGGKFRISEDAEEKELPSIEGTLDGWGSFTSILHKTLIDMQSSDGNQTYRPSELLNSFKKINQQCMDGGQHDSHELLRHLLELVRNEDLRRYHRIILREIGLGEKEKRQSVDEIKKATVKFYGNQASARYLGPEPVFRGVLVSTLECLDCKHSSQRTEPFLDLSLPVMVEKPQPPIYHKKMINTDDSYDLMGNTITTGPSKHQLKKEKKQARKNCKNRRRTNGNINDSLPNENSISEECSGSVAESVESDADVEDNVEGEESAVPIEYGCNNEKDAVKLSEDNKTIFPVNINGNIESGCVEDNKNLLDDSPTDAIMLDVSQNDYQKNNLDEKDCLNISQSSSSNSLNVNCESSPERMNISPLESPEPLKPSPTILINKTTFSEAETDECRSSPEINTIDKKSSLNKINDNIMKLKNNKLDNGIVDITSGFSKVLVSTTTTTTSSQQSATRYNVKDGDCSIQSCLNQFTQLELMSGSNKVGCEACTKRENKGKEEKMICTPSTKQYLVSKVPPVLILHLKRFQSQRFGFRKLSKHVSFPLVLDLAPVCKYHDKPKIYALYGLVEHSGTMHGGHYVAYVKARKPLDANDPRWAFLPKKRTNETEDNNSSESSSDSEIFEASDLAAKVEPPPGRWYYVSDSR